MTTQTPTWFDTHAHLDFIPQPADTLEQARQAGVANWVVPGVSSRNWPQLLELCRRHPEVFAASGLHPQAAAEWNKDTAAELEKSLDHPQVIAVGEIGLDRLLDAPSREKQRDALCGQLRIAIAAKKPVLIHCRKAYGELVEILIEERAEQVGGILHAYGGSLETARTAIDLGFVIAFGGSLTWPEARRAPELLAALPKEAIVLETDAPDMAPHPYRGQQNRPEWLPLIAAKVAEIRGWSLAETAEITTRNAHRALNLPSLRV